MADSKHKRSDSAPTCIECRETIVRGARVCSKCGSHQKRWKDALKFGAATAGLFSLLGGVFVYTTTMMPEVRRTFAWRSVPRVVSLESTRGIEVLNAGDGPLLLSHVDIEIEGLVLETLIINQIAARSQIVRQASIIDERDRSATYGLIEHPSPQEWAQAIQTIKSASNNRCMRAIAFALTDPKYRLYVQAHARGGHQLPSLPASATLHFYDLRTGDGQIDIPSRALLFRRNNCTETRGPTQ